MQHFDAVRRRADRLDRALVHRKSIIGFRLLCMASDPKEWRGLSTLVAIGTIESTAKSTIDGRIRQMQNHPFAKRLRKNRASLPALADRYYRQNRTLEFLAKASANDDQPAAANPPRRAWIGARAGMIAMQAASLRNNAGSWLPLRLV